MGMGKTVQAIAFVSAILGPTTESDTLYKFFQKDKNAGKEQTNPIEIDDDERHTALPVLLVVPAGVIEQWEREFQKWVKMHVNLFHGPDRHSILKRVKGKPKVVVATYDTYRIDFDAINSVAWSFVLFDEVHKIKNKDTLSSRCCKNLNTRRRFGLTGTVMQNDFEELWTLIDFTNPNYLGTLDEFRK